MDKHLITAPEAAAFLRVSLRTVRALIARGTLHAVRIGRRTLLTPDSLDRFVRQHEQGRSSQAA